MQTTKTIIYDPKTHKPVRFGSWSATESLMKDFDPAKSAKRLVSHNKYSYRDMNNKKQ